MGEKQPFSPIFYLGSRMMAGLESAVSTKTQPALMPPRRSVLARMFKNRWAYVFISPFYILFAIFFLYPLLFSIYLGFTKWTGLGPMDFVGLANYALVFQDKLFWTSMLNGVILFLMYVPIMTSLALVLAVILNSPRVRGFQFFRTLIFLPRITNMVAAAFTFRLLLNQQNGLLNVALRSIGLPAIPWLDSVWGARISLSLVIVWAWLGWNMIIMLAGLQTIPKELTEAALIDGASPRQAFFYITIPLMRPVILFTVILSTIGSFDLFTENKSLFPSTDGRGPLNATVTPIVYIFSVAFQNFRLGQASALSYVFFLFVFLLSILQWRYFGEREV
jgi:lactose/L-arabinose transport system permease protein